MAEAKRPGWMFDGEHPSDAVIESDGQRLREGLITASVDEGEGRLVPNPLAVGMADNDELRLGKMLLLERVGVVDDVRPVVERLHDAPWLEGELPDHQQSRNDPPLALGV